MFLLQSVYKLIFYFVCMFFILHFFIQIATLLILIMSNKVQQQEIKQCSNCLCVSPNVKFELSSLTTQTLCNKCLSKFEKSKICDYCGCVSTNVQPFETSSWGAALCNKCVSNHFSNEDGDDDPEDFDFWATTK